MKAHIEAGTAAGMPRTLAGYAMVLPPGWRKIPVRQGTDEAIKQVTDEVFGKVGKSVPREKLVRPRIELRRRLTAMAAQARDNHGLDLYLPVEFMHGSAVPASFVVSEGIPGAPSGRAGQPAPDPSELVAFLATADDASSLITVDGVAGVRTERTAPADPARELMLASRRVDYLLPVPQCPGRWLMVVFSTLGDGDPDGEFTRILVSLFDAIMSTLRWTWA